ncbi:unnamed protein product [Gulo gulo]|uniref:Uncharacterized protein n=1 Tax=Gulo gulo TaxID=48420 RepID=A0A9X9PZX8_GULGU|nr:unnamed protein product [Gulo gulo]
MLSQQPSFSASLEEQPDSLAP